jgi:hypothetical protein
VARFTGLRLHEAEADQSIPCTLNWANTPNLRTKAIVSHGMGCTMLVCCPGVDEPETSSSHVTWPSPSPRSMAALRGRSRTLSSKGHTEHSHLVSGMLPSRYQLISHSSTPPTALPPALSSHFQATTYGLWRWEESDLLLSVSHTHRTGSLDSR